MFLQTGRIRNALVGDKPLARLTIGISNANGQRAEIKLVRDDKTSELVAQLPDAVEDFQPLPPTEDELCEHFLEVNGWQRWGTDQTDGLSDFWKDSLTGNIYQFANAMTIQEGRDLFAGTPDSAATFANGETPLGELYDGE